MHLTSAEDVEDQSLVGVRQDDALVAMLICQVKLGLLHVEGDARRFRHHFNVKSFSRLDADHQLVAFCFPAKNISGNVMVLNSHFSLSLVECFAASQDEVDSIPALVVDAHDSGGECRRVRSSWDCFVIQISERFIARAFWVANVLTKDDVVECQWLNAFKYFDLLVTDVIGMDGSRLLHCHQRQNLQQMILHHIANDSEFVEISAATLRAERFLEGNENRRDVLTIPCRVEELIAESDGHQVLHHFLAQVMVNTVELILSEERGQMIAENLGARRVLSERLLDDDTTPTPKTENNSVKVHLDRPSTYCKAMQVLRMSVVTFSNTEGGKAK